MNATNATNAPHAPPAGVDALQALQDALALPPGAAELFVQLAEGELAAGRTAQAKAILEGLVAQAPGEPDAWALLSQAHRRVGEPEAARFCAEVATELAPEDAYVALVRAESLLALPETRAEGREALQRLSGEEGEVAERARRWLDALSQ